MIEELKSSVESEDKKNQTIEKLRNHKIEKLIEVIDEHLHRSMIKEISVRFQL